MTELCIDFGGSAIKLGVCDDGRILASSELPVVGSPDDLVRAAAELRRLVGTLTSGAAETAAATLVAGDVDTTGARGEAVADDPAAGGARGAAVADDGDTTGARGAAVAERSGAGGVDGGGDWGGASVVAIAVPGVVDRTRAAMVAAHDKYDYLTGFDLDAWARETFGLPAVVENDARAALLGEARYGIARGAQNAVIAIFGTGIGTAALLDGRLLHGSHDHAGILGGHITVDLDGPVCNCGNVGCAEAIASTWALERTLTAVESRLGEQHGASDAQPHRNRPGRPDNSKRDENLAALARGAHDAWRSPVDDSDRDPKWSLDEGAGTLRTRFGAGRAVGIADVVETRDEPASRAVLDLYLRAWSAAIVGLCHAYDPEVVVVSGGVMRSRDLLLPELTRQVHEHLWSSSFRPPLVVPERPDTSVVLGLSALGAAATERHRTS